MTLQRLHSEFPYIRGKFEFLFYQCTVPGQRVGGGGGGVWPGVSLPPQLAPDCHFASVSLALATETERQRMEQTCNVTLIPFMQ
jgi:hypothetical protein